MTVPSPKKARGFRGCSGLDSCQRNRLAVRSTQTYSHRTRLVRRVRGVALRDGRANGDAVYFAAARACCLCALRHSVEGFGPAGPTGRPSLLPLRENPGLSALRTPAFTRS